MMTELIYKFLDNHFGDEVIVTSIKVVRKKEYQINSPKGGRIMSFVVSDIRDDDGKERITLIGNEKVWDMLCGFFPIEKKEAMEHTRNWFGDKHNLKKVNDIKKFMTW
jgi:hypothetical protein